jgi:hypothetical protein
MLNDDKDPPTEYLYSEDRIAEVLGISRSHVIDTRKRVLQPTGNYQITSNHLAYTAEAVELLLEGLKIKLPKKKARPGGLSLAMLLKQSQVPSRKATEAAGELGKEGRLSWQPEAVLIECVRVPTRNRGVVLGRIMDPTYEPREPMQWFAEKVNGDPAVHVRVRDNAKFIPGMEMPCRHVHGYTWELSRLPPRSRGHW